MAIQRFKILPRKVDRRDARLFVIACEGEKTEKHYFDSFAFERVVVRVLDAGEAGLSDSAQVLERLREFKKSLNKWEEGDQGWLILDTDHRLTGKHLVNFREVCAQARRENFELAISHPCFELWLLLHVEDVDCSQIYQASALKKRLRAAFPDYEHRVVELHHGLNEAIERAQKTDSAPNNPWPETSGSRVYRVMQEILKANLRPGRQPLSAIE